MDGLNPSYTVKKMIEKRKRPFTDRIDSQAKFRDLIKDPTHNKKILLYYGLGGIGKTELKEKLASNLVLIDSSAILVDIDFNDTEYRDQVKTLVNIRKFLSKNYKINFPFFDIAYTIYLQRCRPETPIQENDIDFLEPGSLLADIFEVLDIFPQASKIPNAIKFVKKRFDRHKEDKLLESEDMFIGLDVAKKDELPNLLPEFLVQDLKNYLKKNKRKIVMFFDTYEALWETNRTQGFYTDKDLWVRNLILHLHKAVNLFVIFGRDTLYWEEENRLWEKYIEPIELERFEYDDSKKFLIECGIDQDNIREEMIEESEGLPFLLNLFVDEFKDKSKSKDSLIMSEDEDYTSNDSQVYKAIKRFYSYLDTSDRKTLDILSIPEVWDESLFNLLMEKFHSNFPIKSYLGDLKRFSFIKTMTQSGNRLYYLDRTMRKIVNKQIARTNNDFWASVHTYLMNYYWDRYIRSNRFDEDALYHFRQHAKEVPSQKKEELRSLLRLEKEMSTPVIIDRPEERHRFVEFMEDSSKCFLQFVGAPGIGKTTLKNMLLQYLEKQEVKKISITISPKRDDIMEVLGQLSIQIENQYNVSFKKFDFTYAVFKTKWKIKYLLSEVEFDRSKEWVQDTIHSMPKDLLEQYKSHEPNELRRVGMGCWLEEFNTHFKDKTIPFVILIDDAELLKDVSLLVKSKDVNGLKWVFFSRNNNNILHQLNQDVVQIKEFTTYESISILQRSFPNLNQGELDILLKRNKQYPLSTLVSFSHFIDYLINE